MPEFNIDPRVLKALLSSEDDESKPARPVPEAQHMELRDRFRRYNDDSVTFVPGMIVREKPGITMFKSGINVEFILWRFLDDSEYDSMIIKSWVKGHHPLSKIDCMIAHLHDDGTSIIYSLHDTSMLEPVEDA